MDSLARVQGQIEKVELNNSSSTDLLANVQQDESADSDSVSENSVNADSDLVSADPDSDSSDYEWEQKALAQGLSKEQRCSSCNHYNKMKDFRGTRHQGQYFRGLKLFKTCNSCRDSKSSRCTSY